MRVSCIIANCKGFTQLPRIKNQKKNKDVPKLIARHKMHRCVCVFVCVCFEYSQCCLLYYIYTIAINPNTAQNTRHLHCLQICHISRKIICMPCICNECACTCVCVCVFLRKYNWKFSQAWEINNLKKEKADKLDKCFVRYAATATCNKFCA